MNTKIELFKLIKFRVSISASNSDINGSRSVCLVGSVFLVVQFKDLT